MSTFGSRAGENIRNDLKNASGSGVYLTSLKDGKDLRVRFLQEPEDWYKFKEHFSQSTNFFPCTQVDSCPGCQGELRASRRYVSSVLDVAQGKVVPLKMPIDLANRVTNKCDRNGGTLLNRDFTLIRTGKGMNDTTYDVEAEDKTQVDLSRYELVDPEPILEQIFHDTFGDNPQPVRDTSPQAQVAELQAQLQSLQQRQATDTSSVPNVSDEDRESRAPKVESGPVSVQAPGEGFISIDQLNEMDGPALRKFVANNNLTPPEGAIDRQSLLDWLLSEFGVE